MPVFCWVKSPRKKVFFINLRCTNHIILWKNACFLQPGFLRSVSESETCRSFYICTMYSKQEATRLKQEFWTAFGQYMSPILSADGEKVTWVNYKTGEKDIAFRMTADNRKAEIAIELTHKDKEIQQLYFEQFRELKQFLDAATGEEWQWQLHTTDDWGRTVSRIGLQQQGVSVFQKEDWPQLISFFKQRLIALDEFWSQVKYSFESLR